MNDGKLSSIGGVGVCWEAFLWAGPRPGKSSRGGGFILPANFGDVGKKIVFLCLRDGGRSDVTCFVVAVDKAFATDVPAGTHECGVVPLGTILGALAGKMLLPILPSFIKNLEMGAGFFTMHSPLISPDFLFFPPLFFLLPSADAAPVEVGGDFGAGLTKFGGRVTLMVLFITILKTSSKQTRRSFTIDLSWTFKHSPSQRWILISKA